MAFNDIQAWAKILKDEISEQIENDKAIQAVAAEAAQLDTEEFDNLDEDQINISDYKITESEYKASIHDIENEENDQIDFSAYGIIPEADDREPVSHCLDPIGVKASTANLNKENSVQISMNENSDIQALANAIKDLAAKIASNNNGCVDKQDKPDTVSDDTVSDDTVSDDTVSDDTANVIDNINNLEKPEISDPETPLDIEDTVEIDDEQIDDMLKEAEQNKFNIFEFHINNIKEFEENLSEYEDLPLSDENIKTMLNATAEIEKIIQDPNFNNTKLVARKLDSKKKFLIDTIHIDDLSDDMKSIVDSLVEIYDQAIEDFRVPISRTGFAPGTMDYVDPEEGDQWHVAAPKDNYPFEGGVSEPYYNGKIPGFNNNYDWDASTATHADNVAQKYISKLMNRDDIQNERAAKAKEVVRNTKSSDRTFQDWVHILNGLTLEDRKSILNELLSERHLTKNDIALINFLFTGNMNKKTQQMFAKECGMGADLIGNTGAISQVKEKLASYLITIPADLLNVAQDESDQMKHVLRRNDKESREARKELRKSIMREVFLELNRPTDNMPNYEGPTSEKEQYRLVTLWIIMQLFDEGSASDREFIVNALKRYNEDSHHRKFRTDLTPEENKRFLNLIWMAYQDSLITNPDESEHMSIDEIYELHKLNFKRVGIDELAAQAKASKLVDNVDFGTALESAIQLARKWLRAKSGNVTRLKTRKSGDDIPVDVADDAIDGEDTDPEILNETDFYNIFQNMYENNTSFKDEYYKMKKENDQMMFADMMNESLEMNNLEHRYDETDTDKPESDEDFNVEPVDPVIDEPVETAEETADPVVDEPVETAEETADPVVDEPETKSKKKKTGKKSKKQSDKKYFDMLDDACGKLKKTDKKSKKTKTTKKTKKTSKSDVQ